MKTDANPRDVFDLSGPIHLCGRRLAPGDKQGLMAALAQAIYVAENDRLKGRLGTYALAPKWSMELGYAPVKYIHEEEEEIGPIIGATFQRIDTVEVLEQDANVTPIMVVALRGMMLGNEESIHNDMLTNLQLILHQLHTTARFTKAMELIRDAISEVGHERVSIVGHSLGAALALLAGQMLVSEGILVDTHMFNPPYPAPPVQYIKSRRVKLALNLVGMAVATGVSHLLLDSDKRHGITHAFFSLRRWVPHLYINARDPICSSYIGYFMTRDFMQKVGAGPLAQQAAPVSLQGTIHQYLRDDCKTFHLIPCAHVHVATKRSSKLVRAHGLHQWWWPDLEVDHQEVHMVMDE
ncbi:hypothetical protein GOP47_0022979 [Adiantum capillus-veneris]|uniref:AB hydrolase-1 domain-containing protein n=1 Tax=Adiantum capillus-veneris TaxID=13818 RepID=A0A9D4Z621_ADICA|nr:hypothetical protein GOP47_0022979 [Adiantum capillus-veneris]